MLEHGKRQEEPRSRRPAPGDTARARALDLGHLSRQCIGIKTSRPRCCCCSGPGGDADGKLAHDGPASPAAKADIAHRLRGSAAGGRRRFRSRGRRRPWKSARRAGARAGSRGPGAGRRIVAGDRRPSRGGREAAAEIDRLHRIPLTNYGFGRVFVRRVERRRQKSESFGPRRRPFGRLRACFMKAPARLGGGRRSERG